MEAGCFNKKVLHVVISMGIGGAERLVYDMVHHSAFQNNRPVICCMDDLGSLGEALKDEGFTLYCKGRKPGFEFGMIPWLKDIIEKECIDIVHAHQYSSLVYSTPAAFLAGMKKVVYTEHGRFFPDKKNWKRVMINPVLSLGVKHLISISQATAKAMEQNDNFPREKIKIIHNGIKAPLKSANDFSAMKKTLDLPDQCQIIGTAARLNSIKNIQMMLRGLKIILNEIPSVYLVIAGDGEERRFLEGLSKELKIDGNVRFIGMRSDLQDIYPLYEVFLLTSFSEGISVTLLEAMSYGVPAVVTNIGGNVEVVQDTQSGFWVSVDDDLLLAEKVVTILRDPELRKSLSENAKLRIEQNFNRDEMMKNYISCYAS